MKPQCGDAHVLNELKDKTSQQSSRNDIIVIESHSINHISTLTVFKDIRETIKRTNLIKRTEVLTDKSIQSPLMWNLSVFCQITDSAS